MITLISPAKSLNETQHPVAPALTEPRLLAETEKILKASKRLKVKQIMALMDISEKLALLNYERYQAFASQPHFSAVHLFDGDVYDGLQARNLSDEGLRFAQDHLRILSGLYGLLRPLDQIKPYRLEMGLSFSVGRQNNLYGFWGDKIVALLNQDLKSQNDDFIINLASNEYAKAALRKALKARVITIRFMDIKDEKPRTLSFFAKRARGEMARYIIEHQLQNPTDLKNFDGMDYRFDAALSSDTDWVFSRPQPPTL